MDNDKLVQEVIKAMEPIEGPELVTPPPPKPYQSCQRCTHLHKSMARSGGLRGAPTYHKSCIHPEAWDDDSQLNGRPRSLNTGHGGTPGHKTVTPSWCPFLREKDNVLSNSTD